MPDESILKHVRKRPTSTEGVAADYWESRPGGTISPTRLSDLIDVAREIEEKDPWSEEAVRYAGRCFIQANFPHSIRTIDQYAPFVRANGDMRLEIKPSSKYGIPYGPIPRLVLIYIADQVRRHGNPVVDLGDNLSTFMQQLDLVPTGGRWGTITRLRDQLLRLVNSDIRFTAGNKQGQQGMLFAVQRHQLWWDRQEDPKQSDLWRSHIHLTEPLFEELLVHSVPVDMRAIKSMRRSPMELDIYCWLTYRMFSLSRPLFLPYDVLRIQFGANYLNARDFKLNLNKALWSVLKHYPEARVEANARERSREGWKLLPSPPHVPESAFEKGKFDKPKKPRL